MRSSVGLIMSHGAGETVKAHPDYAQTAHHHACLLVLLRGVGPEQPRTLQRIFEKVQKVNNVKIADCVGTIRDISVRYVYELPVENNEWGDFQTHRRLLGLITIGKFDNQTELNELCRQHEALKVRYGTTLYDSRAIFFAADANSSSEIPLEEQFPTPNYFKAQAFMYNSNDECLDLESNIMEFIRSLFWVLESKRIERSRKQIDKGQALLVAPFEKREFVGRDEDSRTQNKRCLGRITKNRADLSLQAGLVEDALELYHKACDILASINDLCWLGAAEEGLCVASIIYHYPFLRDSAEQETEQNVNNSLKQQIDTNIASSSCSSVSSMLNNSTDSTASTPSSTNSTNLDTPRNLLKPEEIPATYRKAIINYSKFTHAAVVETEAALKSARICIQQGRPLDVVMCLQNILHRNLKITEQERVKRFEVIAALYLKISYKRKAAFFLRLAALQHAQQGNNSPDWSQTYRLLLDSFNGYSLTLDPLEMLKNGTGWPNLQIDLLQRLIAAAVRLGYSALATRHMTFLLQTQWHNMSATEQSELTLQLQNLSAQCEGSPVPLKLENVPVIPPANLTDLPYCMEFEVKDLPIHLRPQRLRPLKAEDGPFLFTPIHFASMDRRKNKADKHKIDFSWVQNDVSQVYINLQNPLPYELKVSDIRLLTNGIVFEALPQTEIIQAHKHTAIILKGTPIEVGQLEIQGYSTHTLGVKSNCYLQHMTGRSFPDKFLLNVIPAMPRLLVETSLPPAEGVSDSASMRLYNGESSSFVITLKNDSALPVEQLEINISSNVELDIQNKIFHFNDENVQSKLPLAAGDSVELEVHIFGEANFISTTNSQCAGSLYQFNSSATGNHLQQEMAPLSLFSSSGHASLPSEIGSPYKRNETASSSFRSTASVANSLGRQQGVAQQTHQHSQLIEAQLCIKYSGGQAIEEGYCRQSTIAFYLELMPSAQITSWDVLPAETPSQFYLVLDVANFTTQEMSLNYTDNKSIHIEAKESCRVPIPVDRCSLEKVCNAGLVDYADNLDQDRCPRSPVLSFTDRISNLCAQHITERVQLSWNLTGTNTHGIASLKGITLSSAMTDLITVSPLQWDIAFQDTSVQPQAEILCPAGKSSILSVSVCNVYNQPLKNLELTIKFYQDYLNGMEEFNLKTRVACSGPSRIHIPILEKSEQVHHQCSVIFFTPGRFKASIQCIAKPDVEHQPHFADHANLYLKQQDHVWKFIPPIEVTVVEA